MMSRKEGEGVVEICCLLRDLKVPGSNLDKDKKFIELEIMHNL